MLDLKTRKRGRTAREREKRKRTAEREKMVRKEGRGRGRRVKMKRKRREDKGKGNTEKITMEEGGKEKRKTAIKERKEMTVRDTRKRGIKKPDKEAK